MGIVDGGGKRRTMNDDTFVEGRYAWGFLNMSFAF